MLTVEGTFARLLVLAGVQAPPPRRRPRSTICVHTVIDQARCGPDTVVANVERHGRLAVRAGWQVAPAWATGQRDPHGEVGDGLDAVVPVRQRWHRPGDVFGEQRDQASVSPRCSAVA